MLTSTEFISLRRDAFLMFLRLGLISFVLLLASRVSGLARESAQAAAFGVSGNADIAILMMTLPDLLVNVFFLGGLSYIALPLWASQSPQDRASSQRTMLVWCLGVGTVLAVLLLVARQWVIQTLAPGLSAGFMTTANNGIIWSALLIAPTCLAALWYCRLQFERDFVGLYGWNVLVNGVMILAFVAIHAWFQGDSIAVFLGLALVLAMALRLGWQWWRLSRLDLPSPAQPAAQTTWPAVHQFAWAALAAGLPLTIPLIARTFSAANGEGALAIFNYAIKLVELPNALAIQLVTTLAFPSVTRALVAWREAPSVPNADPAGALPDMRSVRSAYILAWTLACVGAAGLAVGAQSIAALLFGWGRMRAVDVQAVAQLAALGAWSLLPQALIAVTVTVLAANHQLKEIALAFLMTAAAFILVGWQVQAHPSSLQAIGWMNASLVFLATALMIKSRTLMRKSLPALEMAIVAAATVVCVVLASYVQLSGPDAQMALACVAALVVGMVGLAVSPSLRSALRR
jgi:peptidoglycan biosynthesis protein MviN/MurJ (putative lipid II flippase)